MILEAPLDTHSVLPRLLLPPAIKLVTDPVSDPDFPVLTNELTEVLIGVRSAFVGCLKITLAWLLLAEVTLPDLTVLKLVTLGLVTIAGLSKLFCALSRFILSFRLAIAGSCFGKGLEFKAGGGGCVIDCLLDDESELFLEDMDTT